MRWLTSFFRERERKLDAELQFHLEQQARDNIAAGMTPEEARRRAQLEFGGLEQIKERCRDERPALWFEQTAQDLRYALRQLAKAPGFAVVAIVTLALGIGATTAIFSVVNSVLLKPLPYPESERLVAIRETQLSSRREMPVAPANFRDWSGASGDIFETIYAERGTNVNLTGLGEPVRIAGGRVSHLFFIALRGAPLLGRVFGPEDDRPEGPKVVVLNHGFWLRQFGGRREVVGETIRLDGQPYTVIGVMPADFQRGFAKEIYLPLALGDREWEDRKTHSLSVFARLKTGVTIEQARAHLTVIAAQLAKEYPESNKDLGAVVLSLLEGRTASVRPLLLTLLGAVGLLLLIACTNVANLLLARATTREREISLRVALGATRGRILRQLIVESLVLTLAGALLGLLVARGGLAALLAYAPQALPRSSVEIYLDGRAVLATLALALATGVTFGLMPLGQSGRGDLSGAMKSGGRTGAGPRGNLLRNGLVVTEIALALILLAGAGLLIRSFAEIGKFDPGFNPRGVTAVAVLVSSQKYNTPEKQRLFADAVVERYRGMPGVADVGVSQLLPGINGYFTVGVSVEGREAPPGPPPEVNQFSVGADYFRTLGIRLVQGRPFDERDRLGATPVAILGQSAANRLFPGENPLGRRIAFSANPKLLHEVVGVAADTRGYDLERETPPQAYTAFAQRPFPIMNFLLRTGEGTPPAAALRQAVYAVDPEQPVAQLRAFDDVLMIAFSRQQFAMTLFAIFSGIALVLAMVGIYGVMAFTVSRRTTEFGVRFALGARSADVMRLVLGQAARLVTGGIALGLLGAIAAGRFVEALLYRTPATDPLVLGGIAALLLLVALGAAFLPARRATKVDPMIALRAE